MKTRIRTVATTLGLMALTAIGTAVIVKSSVAAQDPAMDEAKMMEMMMKAAEPGPHHKALAARAGKWKVKTTSYMSGQPEVSEGDTEIKMLLGDRYSMGTFKGDAGGLTFEGVEISGYDNVVGEHFCLWFDSMGTGTLMMTAKPAAEGAALEFKGTARDVLTPKGRPFRMTRKIVSPDEMQVELFDSMPVGDKFTETKIMAQTLTRAKAAGPAK